MDIYKYLAEISSAHTKRPGLERINLMLEHLGHPERDYEIVHIVGTNGKGSTAQFIASILQAAGQQVGLFTSPHLVEFTERIQVNRATIPEEDLNRIFQELYPCIQELAAGPYGRPGLFEVATAVGLKYFSEMGVDYAVLEAGMGGRYDATNVGSPAVTVITHIDLDHTEVLGDTVELIAAEKAEGIRPGGIVVTAPQSGAAKEVIAAMAARRGAKLIDVEQEYQVSGALPGPRGTSFAVSRRGLRRHFHINMLGLFQITNAVTALAAVDALVEKGLRITDRQVVEGMEKARWPGRLEVVAKDPLVVLDGAHNLDGCRQLAAALPVYFTWRRLHLIMAITGQKPYKSMLQVLLPEADTVVFTTPQSSRSAPADPNHLQELAQGLVEKAGTADSFGTAFREVKRYAHPQDLICVCGSLYLVGEARKLLGPHGDSAGIVDLGAEISKTR
ncbi:MAG: bifunctional folylpolyglutamate synthase/dihydrofolate synthase [Firmicutes bacterium]|nr:bifunctional folylpolyglutamate synthase/dihydrofolate synthase [Bacillota bacterium]